MGPPGGGPKDEEAPRVIEVKPATGSTSVDPKSNIEIVFSEPVSQESLESALFITPTPQKKPKIKVKGNSVKIRLREAIPSDRTLLLSIGTDLTDLQRNRLEAGYTIALTAGETIDKGKISGRIFTSKDVQGMLVGAWIIGDSIEFKPTEVKPDFIAHAGLKGEFSLEYIPPGSYRLLCFDDRDHDLLYDPSADRLGLPWQDVLLPEGGETWMELYPVKRDTSRLSLYLVSASDNKHLTLRYNRLIDTEPGILISKLAILDSSSSLSIERVWISTLDSTRLILYTNTQTADREYSIVFAEDTTVFNFTGSANPDTVGPVVIDSSPANGDRGINEIPNGWIAFDDALADIKNTARLREISQDSTKPTTEYTIELVQKEINMLNWKVSKALEFGKSYTLELDLTSIVDRSGNVSPDTLWSTTFTVVDPVETGSISGTIEGQIIFPIIGARSFEGRTITEKLVSAKAGNTFTIDRLKAGEYLLWLYSDMDRDQKYNIGNVEPFRFADHFSVSDDTVKVRNRWDTAGRIIRFK
ncbi:Ig-like domain-containing protein [bacterium]|nr:Ig-like domain-containing protein [bacterium]